MLVNISGILVEQPGSPRISRGSNFYNVTTERTYAFKNTYFYYVQKSLESGDTGIDGDGYLADYQLQHGIGYSYLTLVFSTIPPDGSLPAINAMINTPQYYLSKTQNNIPLSQLKKYRTKWDHLLAGIESLAGTSAPSFWDSATDTVISSTDAKKYRWIDSASQLPDGWVIIKDKTKTAEEKLNFAPVVREERWVRTLADAVESIIMETQILSPGVTYGFNGQWLAEPTEVSPESDLFRLTTVYTGMTTWDEDIYGDQNA